MRRALTAAGIANARILEIRSEEWAAEEGRESYDAVTARAVGRLSTLAELASPLLRQGGALVAWKGRRNAEEEAQLERAAEELALQPQRVIPVGAYAGSRNRHLHVVLKAGATPPGIPRRPGMAKKRPRGN
jgi:16S rRNA (guanine527-N7)-methyltransferase